MPPANLPPPYVSCDIPSQSSPYDQSRPPTSNSLTQRQDMPHTYTPQDPRLLKHPNPPTILDLPPKPIRHPPNNPSRLLSFVTAPRLLPTAARSDPPPRPPPDTSHYVFIVYTNLSIPPDTTSHPPQVEAARTLHAMGLTLPSQPGTPTDIPATTPISQLQSNMQSRGVTPLPATSIPARPSSSAVPVRFPTPPNYQGYPQASVAREARPGASMQNVTRQDFANQAFDLREHQARMLAGQVEDGRLLQMQQQMRHFQPGGRGAEQVAQPMQFASREMNAPQSMGQNVPQSLAQSMPQPMQQPQASQRMQLQQQTMQRQLQQQRNVQHQLQQQQEQNVQQQLREQNVQQQLQQRQQQLQHQQQQQLQCQNAQQRLQQQQNVGQELQQHQNVQQQLHQQQQQLQFGNRDLQMQQMRGPIQHAAQIGSHAQLGVRGNVVERGAVGKGVRMNGAVYRTEASVPATPTTAATSASQAFPATPSSPDKTGSSSNGSGQREHACTYPGCNKTFDRRYNLTVHYRRHTDEMPYPCKVEGCAQRFKWRSSQSHHMKTRHHQVVKGRGVEPRTGVGRGIRYPRASSVNEEGNGTYSPKKRARTQRRNSTNR